MPGHRRGTLLWRDRGMRGGARDLLAPVYGRFAEGFDLADLRDAGALLDALGWSMPLSPLARPDRNEFEGAVQRPRAGLGA